jgi:AraC-like DNA-binding protein
VRGEGNGADVSDGLVRFFAAAFAPNVTRAQQVAARLGVPPSTLASRFYRAALPSPKQYVAWARLVWAARLGESPALSVSLIAHRLDASSPQSFSRTVRTLTGLTAAEFRRRHTGAGMLDRFRALLVRPYRDTLCTFNPLHVIPAPVAARVRVPLIAGRAA